MDRLARLVLVEAGGRPLGVLPAFAVGVPWWQEVADVVAGARAHFGVDVAVLRLLAADRPAMPGGTVTYVAETADPLPAAATTLAAAGVDPLAVTAKQPHRAAYAEPGGPGRSLAWARDQLGRRGWTDVTAGQHRTWNLSAIWQLDGRGDRAWLKQVPPFFRHEGAVLRWLNAACPGRAPELLAEGDDGRLLMADVPGVDWYDADSRGRHRVAVIAHELQLTARRHLDALAAAGVPDRRGHRLADWIRATLAPHTPGVDDVVPDLDDRVAAAAAGGLPDTLVHGDLHPGNTRVDGDADPVVIDWGDSFLGSPVFDILRLCENADDAEGLEEAWSRRWREAVPGSDPDRAIAALRPVAALRSAAVYAEFLANIEPSEHPYHAADVPRCLGEARAAAAGHTVGA